MTTVSMPQKEQASFAQRIVRLDAAIFLAASLLLLAANQALGSLVGIASWMVILLGISGVIYDGGRLFWALRSQHDQTLIRVSAVANAIFAVVFGVMLLVDVGLTNTGWWILALLVDVALILAAIQFYGGR